MAVLSCKSIPYRKLLKSCVLFLVLWAVAEAHALVPKLQISKNNDGNMELSWLSESDVSYQIESASQVEGPWETRATIASQGVSTKWVDSGDATHLPSSQDRQRFYRVAQLGSNRSDLDAPISMTLSQTGVVSGFLTVTIGSSTTRFVSGVRLYVDGEEVRFIDALPAVFEINTTEWANGSHELIATVETTDSAGLTVTDASAPEADPDQAPRMGFSNPVKVDFANFISEWTFSNPQFQTAWGETQEIFAKLESPAHWTLRIVNVSDPANPFEVYGVENTANFVYLNWTGVDYWGEEAPDGFYDYILEASTEGAQQALLQLAGDVDLSTSKALATAVGPTTYKIGSGQIVKRPTNRAELKSLYAKVDRTFPKMTEQPGASAESKARSKVLKDLIQNARTQSVKSSRLAPDALLVAAGAGAKSQQTRRPSRPESRQAKGFRGVVGIMSQGHHPKYSTATGEWRFKGNVGPFGPINSASAIADGFDSTMTRYGWRTNFKLKDDQVNRLRLTGVEVVGREAADVKQAYFNKYSQFAFLVGHMVANYTPSGDDLLRTQHSYFPVYKTGVNRYDWVQLPLVSMGVPDVQTGFTAWGAMYGCNNLNTPQVRDIIFSTGGSFLSFGPRMRVLLGTEYSFSYLVSDGGSYFAKALHGQVSNVGNTVVDAWKKTLAYAAGQFKASGRPHSNPIVTRASWLYRTGVDGGSSESDSFVGGNMVPVDGSEFGVSFGSIEVYRED